MPSNQASKILADLARHKQFPDLTIQDAGKDLCKIATDQVLEGIIGQVSPDGTPWAPLSTSYEEWKAKKFPGLPMAVLHFRMAQPEEVAGTIEVDPDCATVTYGVTDQAVLELTWFQDGDPAHNRPPRPVWGLTEEAEYQSKLYFDARFTTFAGR